MIYICFILCVGYLLQLRTCDRHFLGCARYLLKLLNVLKIYSSFLKVMNIYLNLPNTRTSAEFWLLSLTYHFATHSLWFFIRIFAKKFRAIFNKNVGCDRLITFWKKPRSQSFIPSLQPIITWLLNFFENKIIISKWDKKLLQIGAASTSGARVISKRGRNNYFKVGQSLFQSGAIISKCGKRYSKVGQSLRSGAKCYFKMGQLFQSGA